MANNNPFKAVSSFQGKVFQHYRLQLENQDKLLRIIKAALPDNLAGHALYCVNSGNKISLYTDSAAWSSQLRFYHQAIMQALKSSAYAHFDLLQIKIIPKDNSATPKKIKKIIPSENNINLIVSESEHQSDEELKVALHKLATTFKNKSK